MPHGKEPGSRARTRASLLGKIKQLYTHENHQYITGTQNGGFLVLDKKTKKQRMWPGILDRLHATFYPRDPQDPWERTRQGITARRTVTVLPRKLPGKEDGKSECWSSGADHGDLVHRQMEHWANCVKTFGFDDGTRAFVEEHPSFKRATALDPCVVRIMDKFQEWGWLPVDSERNIWDPVLKFATRIDLVAVELATNKLVFIELKTSGSLEEYGALEDDPCLEPPLQEVACCPESVHQLQLLSGMLMAKKRYKGMVPDAGFVVRSHTKTKKVTRHEPPAWARSALNQRNLYAALKPRRG
jgi:hypothetical protein